VPHAVSEATQGSAIDAQAESEDGMSDDSKPVPHKRRPRYKGTHPRTFKEKYKEATDPKTIEKIIAKGGTPAGTHRPIMVSEILEWLNPQPGKVYVDCTLGYGGHTTEILKRIQPNGKLFSFDRDPIESAKTEKRVRDETKPADGTWIVVHDNYSALTTQLKRHGVAHVDGLLADLGLSSMQIDDPSRGFTFKQEGPLDLRMNPLEGEPASELLQQLSQEELQSILEENSDEPRAKWCAKAILDQQKKKPIETTTDFANAIRAWIKTLSPKTREQEGDTPIRRAMQALRIEVNQEFSSLDRLLEQIPKALNKNGRVAILSFHSGEDRRVKKTFQACERSGLFQFISPEAIRPSFDEQRSNTRSKSAKLRLAER
jgi:16S rRNA (cytosine1402-N4)-methyltransferase